MNEFLKGSKLPSFQKPAITREQLALYARASQDNNPIHLDEEVAKKAGLPSVIAHGMLTMAFMGEYLYFILKHLGWDGGKISKMSCHFKAMVFPGDEITIQGTVKQVTNEKLECEIDAINSKKEVVAIGTGVLSSH